MKLGKKGFTMVELLGVITIMGILMAIAVPSVIKYVDKARKTAMETMLKSTYEAAENYMSTSSIGLQENSTSYYAINVKDLVDDELLESLSYPYGGGNCHTDGGSIIRVYRLADTAGGLPNYIFDIRLRCKNGSKVTKEIRKIFPEEIEADFSYSKDALSILREKGLL